MSINSHTGSMTEATSYDAFDTSAIRNSNLPARTPGRMELVISGGFRATYYTSYARVGLTACAETIWSSVTTVRCKRGFALGRTLSVRVTTAIVSNSTSESFSFDIVEMSSLQPANLPLTGGTYLSVFGSQFSAFDSTLAVRTDRTACPVSIWSSDSSVSCLVPFGVHVSEPRVLVTTAGNMRTWTASFSFDTKSTARFVEVDLVYSDKAIQQLYCDSSFFDEKFVDDQTANRDASVYLPGSNNEKAELIIDGYANDAVPWTTISPPTGLDYTRIGASNTITILSIIPDEECVYTMIRVECSLTLTHTMRV